ncbi:hypothetical protein AB1N83_013108 [Pleurotus pulmonarius]
MFSGLPPLPVPIQRHQIQKFTACVDAISLRARYLLYSVCHERLNLCILSFFVRYLSQLECSRGTFLRCCPLTFQLLTTAGIGEKHWEIVY